jgi:hypothetical protein
VEKLIVNYSLKINRMQHSNFSAATIKTCMVFFAAILFSSAVFAGGDSYKIYLNKKLVTEQFVSRASSGSLNLNLGKANYNDEISVYYNHCGTVGKGRSIVIKDSKDNILKEWKFSDSKDGNAPVMTIQVKDILAFKKNNSDASLKLYYFSAQYLPQGRLLTSITLAEKNTAFYEPYKTNEWSRLATAFTFNILSRMLSII